MSAPGSPATDVKQNVPHQPDKRGLEYGIAIPEGAHNIMVCLPDDPEDA
ncbi:hypothetical protein [Erwinia psidii]|nr:hypothetical protein [Erwinia psidii]